MGSILMPSLWRPPSWIADYYSWDGAVRHVPSTLFCSTAQTLQMTLLGMGQTAPSLEQPSAVKHGDHQSDGIKSEHMKNIH